MLFRSQEKKAGRGFPLMTVATGNDNVRLAVDYAVAKATGGELPKEDIFTAPLFEDSLSGKPNPVTCDASLPGDVYLSAQMPGSQQAELGQ